MVVATHNANFKAGGCTVSAGVIAKTVRGFSEALEATLAAETTARGHGLLQALDHG